MLKKIWFQIHWFLGITAGTLLVVVGITGATLSFEDEVLEWLNPGVVTVAPHPQATLTPGQIIDRLRQQVPEQQVATVLLRSEPGYAARVGFVPLPGATREVRYVDPYSGDLLPHARGIKFFEFVDSLHRWMLLPKNIGSLVTGSAAACLLVLALSGLYLRWPRHVTDWRRWLKLDFALTGRPFLWNLHAVLGTWALITYLVFTISGLYWSFGWVGSSIDALAGKVRPQRPAVSSLQPAPMSRPRVQAAETGPIDLGPSWKAFLKESGGYSNVLVRVPQRANQSVNFQYLDNDPPHDRARNRMEVTADGVVRKHERFADSTKAVQLVNSFRPLHTGSYWGLPGRIVMMLGALGLPVFAISGWMLYLKRRKTNRELKAARRALMTPAGSVPPTSGIPMLLVFASQSGRSERIVLGATKLLQASGVLVKAVSMARLDMAQLAGYKRALFVVSTFGDGEPPDVARRFAQQLSRAADRALAHMSYGVMALGDSQYASFCGFGRILDLELRNRGGSPMFPVVEMDKEDPLALEQWHRHLEALGAVGAGKTDGVETQAAQYQTWHLRQRSQLNLGSQGRPMYHLEFDTGVDELPAWHAGALVEIMPSQTDTPRRYSVASIPQDGRLHLVVRQVALPDGGLGLASGWLTAGVDIHASVQIRLIENPGFALIDDDLPCIFIGNGSGIAGLRSHLRERVRLGHRRNWLLFGERNAVADTLYEVELSTWQAEGCLPELDRVFSRDSAEHPYVQDRLRGRAEVLKQWLEDGAVIYVCGSLQGMAGGIDQVLGEVLGEPALEDLIADGRYRRDVY